MCEDDTCTQTLKFENFSQVFEHSCLLVPLIDGNYNEETLYAAFCSSWKVKSSDGEFIVPELPALVYEYMSSTN